MLQNSVLEIKQERNPHSVNFGVGSWSQVMALKWQEKSHVWRLFILKDIFAWHVNPSSRNLSRGRHLPENTGRPPDSYNGAAAWFTLQAANSAAYNVCNFSDI